jgi:hypothetical protein
MQKCTKFQESAQHCAKEHKLEQKHAKLSKRVRARVLAHFGGSFSAQR